jgi:hypothetical protein
MVEVSNEVATIFVPLVIGLVVQLSNIERGRDEGPAELIDTDPFFLSGGLVPELGRLNFVHGTNLILLLGCYLLAIELEPSLLKTLLIVFVLLVWLQLPVLEVKQYGKILNEGSTSIPLRSFDVHIVTTLVTAAFVWQFGDLSQFVGAVNLTVLQPSDFLRNAVVLLVGLSWVGFLYQLNAEIGSCSWTDSPESQNQGNSTKQTQ